MYVLMLVTTVEFGHVILTRIGDVEVEMISTATHCKYISVSMFLMLTEVSNVSRFCNAVQHLLAYSGACLSIQFVTFIKLVSLSTLSVAVDNIRKVCGS